MKLSKNFSRQEFACNCGCGFDTVDAGLLKYLECIRQHFDSPITITSGCRCFSHNAYIGGSKNSFHLRGRAADFIVKGVHPYEVYQYCDEKWPQFFGLGRYETFTHFDTRTIGPARWEG